MAASLPSSTITGTSAADTRTSTPGTNALVETYQGTDTITLSNSGDWAYGGDGDDFVRIGTTSLGAANNNIIGGQGNDSIFVTTAQNILASNSLSVSGAQGSDTISIITAGTFNTSFVGGGVQGDSITVGAATLSTSTVKGGDHADTMVLQSGNAVSTYFSGNKGSDSIVVGISASNNSSIAGGLGHDTINLGTGGASGGLSWVAGGAGNDSITVASGMFQTISGGGLADTIAISGTISTASVIYGDAVGVLGAGTGTGGTADGADLITASAATASVSVYGGGAADTISFVSASNTAGGLLLNGGNLGDSIRLTDFDATGVVTSIAGGNGADSITINTGASKAFVTMGAGQDSIFAETTSAITINGGAGQDTIHFTNLGVSADSIAGGAHADVILVGTAVSAATGLNGSGTLIDGGNGADSIVMASNSGSSIFGGAGNDSIRLTSGGALGLAYTAAGTINGGAGTDTINLDATTGSTVVTALTAAVNIAYEAGDVIVLTNTSIAGGAAYNGNVYVGASGVGVSAGTTLTAGNLAVYSDGTDTFFSFVLTQGAGAGNNATGSSALAFRVMGADLVTSGIVNALAGVTTANFGFTLSSTANSGLTITLL